MGGRFQHQTACFALVNTSVSNYTTILLFKPDFKDAYRSVMIPPIPGISVIFAAQYVTATGKQQNVWLYNSLGQKVPSVCVHIPFCHVCSMVTPMVQKASTSLESLYC